MGWIGKLFAGATSLLLILSFEASAQTMPPWSAIPFPVMGKGRAACTHLGGQGDVFCFGLRCEKNTLEWFTYQVGGDSSEGDVAVKLTVDGGPPESLSMKQRKTPIGEWSFSTPFDLGRDHTIIEKLKTGSRLTVLVGEASGARLSLRNSARSIEQAAAMCGVSSKPEALRVTPGATELTVTPQQLPTPVLAEMRNIAAICGTAFKTTDRNPNALLAEDINQDGVYDFLLDQAQFCPDAILTMCGASHCPFTLFVSNNGSWRRFDFILQGYKEFTRRGFLLQCSNEARKAGVFMENGELKQRNCQ